MQHAITPRKLLHSKWTAVKPEKKEKHFMITDVEFDDDGQVIKCVIEAIMSKREQCIQWRELKNTEKWKIGWQ